MHFLAIRPRNTASLVDMDMLRSVADLSYDPNLIMAALFMDLLVALTCGCLILSKTMLFVYAWVLRELPLPVYAWKQMSYFNRKKLSLQYCLKLSCNYNNTACIRYRFQF